ncbi:MAG TPA: ABC transporter substrate-binding protein [Xanthobacteraceae bacterium]|nr:ABC transporter substrate-binding protein [Xanthobacteraceae bacterium]
MRRLTTFLLACGLIAALSARARAEDVLKLAVPQRGAWDTGIEELGQRSGIFAKHGLKLEILYTSAGPESIQALIAGSVDIATASGAYAAFGTYAKGAPIRIIGSEVIGSPDLYWFVPAASPIHKIEDLNGKTVGFSLPGSSSHAGLLALIAQYHLQVKPVSTGSLASTITQTMTGQVDVGWSAVPYALDKAADKEIRVIATGNDVIALRARTGRVNLTNVATLTNRKDALKRFAAAYNETLDWMYASPDALKMYAEFAKLPASAVDQVRGLIPKEALVTDKVVGVDQIMSEAIASKFLAKPLTKEQLNELIRTQDLK